MGSYGCFALHNQGSSSGTPLPCFIVMGKTGSGKSSFIKIIGGRDERGNFPDEDPGLNSCTLTPTIYGAMVQNTKILLLDTPGFDDSARDNLQVLHEISGHLYAFAMDSNIEIRGIIFLHDISELRMSGSQKKTWDILKAIVGNEGMGNLIIGTTMWSTESPQKLLNEEQREKSMWGSYWRGAYKTMRVVHQDQTCALKIITDLFWKPAVTILIQKELMLPPHTVENTTAGRIAIPEGREESERLRKELEELKMEAEQRKRETIEARQRMEEEVRSKEREYRARLEEERRRHEEELRRREEEFRRLDDQRRRLDYEFIQRAGDENRRRDEEYRTRWEEQNRRCQEEHQRQLEERRREFQDEMSRLEERRRLWEEDCRRTEEENRIRLLRLRRERESVDREVERSFDPISMIGTALVHVAVKAITRFFGFFF